ncbi:MAG: precorrin-3B synthase [Rhodobacterales bacterium 32-67-9]|nr:MAG: precorrin-3B synthase [Rhodobacterales bacterium 32-67-9]
MSAPVIQGWCPGALRPMMSGDGLVVRVRPRGGRLTPEQAAGIATLSLRHGNGLIDLSSRANVQLRGVTEAGHRPLIEGLSALGLIDETTEAESHRNIVVTPFWSDGDGIQGIVRSLAAALTGPDAPDTPGKFGYAVDCGAAPVLSAVSADIRIERAVDGGLVVRADGAGTGARATAAAAAERALDLARWFLDSGGAPERRGRMAAHLARGANLPPVFTEVSASPHPAVDPVPGLVAQGFLVGFEFGQMRAESLSLLAGFGPLRVTPWRMLLIEGAGAVPEIAGLITGPDNPLLRVVACTGAPGCPQGLIATRTLARRLCSALAPGNLLHVSGCAKGCAHRGAAPLTLVGRVGGTVDLIRGGTATDSPCQTGLDPETLTFHTLTETAHAS